MNNKKQELKKIKKHELHSSWHLILLLSVITMVWFLITYMVAIFENKYSSDSGFKLFNDITISILAGLISGILTILLAFVFLDLLKRFYIKDYFHYYSYINSLRNKSKFVFFKDSKIPNERYNKTKETKQMTKSTFINLVADILGYTLVSPQYKNLINEIDSDFAMHSFITPNFNSQRKFAITRIVFLDILFPLIVSSIIIAVIVILYKKQDENVPISAITRILIILLANIFSLSFSITIYEFYILNKVKDYNSFNDFYLLSFNNFEFKYLNSSLIKR